MRLELVLVLAGAAMVKGIGLPLPKDNLFQVIWQMPHGLCRKFADKVPPGQVMDFRLDEFGIINNPRGRFDGEYTSIFYHFGRFPMYAFSNPDAKDNGGIPQRGDLELHMMDAVQDIMDEIPNPEFGGIAVINQEEWRPLFRRNFGVKAIYQDESILHYMEQNPDETNMDNVIQGATDDFEYWAKHYTVESLRLGHSMRPNGLWGYYAYPYCYNYNDLEDQCSEKTREGNTEMKWLWDESSVILPSIYYFKEYEPEQRARFLYSQIEEGVRVSKLTDQYLQTGVPKPVYVYTKMKFNMSMPVAKYRKEDMYASLRMPVDFGVEGVMLWGSDPEFNELDSCMDMKQYITEIIGPYVKQINNFVRKCASKKCSGNGRCVHRGTLDYKYRSEVHRLNMEHFNDFKIDERYQCVCLPGYSGTSCENVD